MKERMYFSGCLQVLASQCAMKYCPSYLHIPPHDATTCGCPGSIGAVYRMMEYLKYKLNNHSHQPHTYTQLYITVISVLLCSKSKCLHRSGFLEAGLLLAVGCVRRHPTDALVSLVCLSSRLVEARIVVAACLS